jgi:asparagine synthase (glutamine-hydrolysing)
MFAFVIWDKQRQKLFLARDRFGVKPLYYTRQGQIFLFGSEVKAMLAHPACQARLDKEALLEYFTFQNFFTDRTLFADVRLLPAGCTLSVALGAQTPEAPRRYWDYDFVEPDKHYAEQE